MTSVYRFISLSIWGNLPSQIQRKISQLYARVYDRPYSKFIIRPYCRFNNLSEEYLDQFVSSTGHSYYSSFQDFFTRVYKEALKIDSEFIWPCEGLLCEYGQVSELPLVNVKGDKRNVRTIFGEIGSAIPDTYHFSNVFLHNNNYHRIHSPISGKIKSIEHIPGDLILLRPWVYKSDPSLPAMRNERVNIVITDFQQRDWFLSIVGGPAVGTIELPDYIQVDSPIAIGKEVGKFLLGSTLCMASPEATNTALNSTVYVAQKY